jgi:hypothetical protein
MSNPDNNFEVKDGVVQPETADTYNLVVDENGQVQMVPVK